MKKTYEGKIRYAAVAAGWFGQAAVLPAFRSARENSELAAIVSGDPEKRRELADLYSVPAYSYEQYDDLMASGKVDAVFLVLPNSMHRDFTIRAARHGVHVLCEKPLAASSEECQEMIDACAAAGVKLMTAYRLHFEEGNLTAADKVRNGEIGEPRIFSSVFTQQVEANNSRLDADLASNPLRDIGIYCINAARYLFADEPTEAVAVSATRPDDPRFREMFENVTAVLRFPGERLATFTCGFGSASVAEYTVVGTTGVLKADPAYTFEAAIELSVKQQDGKAKSLSFKHRDQVGAEIVYFSDCLRADLAPEPDGVEGLIDLKIIEAIESSLRHGNKPVPLSPLPRKARPTLSQSIHLSPPRKPELVNAEEPQAK